MKEAAYNIVISGRYCCFHITGFSEEIQGGSNRIQNKTQYWYCQVDKTMQWNHAYPRAKLSGDKRYLQVPIDANVTFHELKELT